MDIGSLPTTSTPTQGRPDGCDRVALVLQGGGALGAYQAGVYQALHEARLEPDWVAGVSIGGINGAIIAGNPPERRLARLREFWNLVSSRRVWLFPPDGDAAHRAHNMLASWYAMTLGQPGFFAPRKVNPWFAPRGSSGATSFYDTAPLRETLLKLVDFDLLSRGTTRYACGAVNVGTGNFAYFDNAETPMLPEHVMASGALPPALPMVRIGTDWYWDGGIVSNTPLQHLIDHVGNQSALVFQVDLFSARGPIPRDMSDVSAREKDIRFSSRTRLTTDRYTQLCTVERHLRALLERLPDGDLTAEERDLKRRLRHLPRLSILQMVYAQKVYEGEAKDYDFSTASMHAHWDAGYRDTVRTLRHRDWLALPTEEGGIAVHDIHRVND